MQEIARTFFPADRLQALKKRNAINYREITQDTERYKTQYRKHYYANSDFIERIYYVQVLVFFLENFCASITRRHCGYIIDVVTVNVNGKLRILDRAHTRMTSC